MRNQKLYRRRWLYLLRKMIHHQQQQQHRRWSPRRQWQQQQRHRLRRKKHRKPITCCRIWRNGYAAKQQKSASRLLSSRKQRRVSLEQHRKCLSRLASSISLRFARTLRTKPSATASPSATMRKHLLFTPAAIWVMARHRQSLSKRSPSPITIDSRHGIRSALPHRASHRRCWALARAHITPRVCKPILAAFLRSVAVTVW